MRLPPLIVRWLGRVPYEDAAGLQERLVEAIRAGRSPDHLLLLEHDPVVTLGRSSRAANLLLSPSELAARAIALHESGRGGDVTFHGPGQLVGYPVVRIPEGRRDLHRYLRDLEEALIRTASEFGIEAARSAGQTGVWVGNEKLAAIGVRVSTGWIAWHGFALNVGADLSGFETIVPCGIADKGVTSIARLTGTAPALREVAAVAARHVAQILGFEPFASGVEGEELAIPPPSPLSSPPRRAP